MHWKFLEIRRKYRIFTRRPSKTSNFEVGFSFHLHAQRNKSRTRGNCLIAPLYQLPQYFVWRAKEIRSSVLKLSPASKCDFNYQEQVKKKKLFRGSRAALFQCLKQQENVFEPNKFRLHFNRIEIVLFVFQPPPPQKKCLKMVTWLQ